MGAKSTQILAEIRDRLRAAYGAPSRPWEEVSLEAMIAAVLVHPAPLEKVEQALSQARKRGPLSIEALHGLSRAELAERFRPAGKFGSKLPGLQSLLGILYRKYEGDISRLAARPTGRLRAEFLALPGIGPETADRILLDALGHLVFPVDIHAYRVFSRHGLAAEESGYEELQEIAAQIQPGEPASYREFHELLARAGREYCRPKANCEKCPLKGVNW